MTYLQEVNRALGERGISHRTRQRILVELEDHLCCDPEAWLGDPQELAGQFANELGAERARRAALAAFTSLAVLGATLVATQASLGAYPDVASGSSMILAGLAGFCVFFVSQVAFVAGALTLLQAVRLRDVASPSAAEIGLIRRRISVALGSNALVALGIALYAANFWGQLPAWWATLNLAAAGGCWLLMAAGALIHRRALQIVVSGAGGTPDLIDELGPLTQALEPVRGRPRVLAVLVGALVVATTLLGAWYAESSVTEGLLRASFEAAAFATGFIAVGRPLGLRDG